MDLAPLPEELIDVILIRPELAKSARLICQKYRNYHGDWEHLMDCIADPRNGPTIKHARAHLLDYRNGPIIRHRIQWKYRHVNADDNISALIRRVLSPFTLLAFIHDKTDIERGAKLISNAMIICGNPSFANHVIRKYPQFIGQIFVDELVMRWSSSANQYDAAIQQLLSLGDATIKLVKIAMLWWVAEKYPTIDAQHRETALVHDDEIKKYWDYYGRNLRNIVIDGISINNAIASDEMDRLTKFAWYCGDLVLLAQLQRKKCGILLLLIPLLWFAFFWPSETNHFNNNAFIRRVTNQLLRKC